MNFLSEKIKTPRQFLVLAKKLKRLGKKLVQCDGVFDLVHPGHIHYFRQAKKQGHILYVALVADKFVRKGKGRPVFNQNLRAGWVAGIEGVDYVVVNNDFGPYELIKKIHPDVLVKGESYRRHPTEGFLRDKQLVESYGGRVFFSRELNIHSTDLLKKLAKR